MLAAALALLGLNCYSFTGSNLPSYVKSIAIANFQNETLEPDVGQQVTRGVTDTFIEDGRLKLASDRAADARLSGTVTRYENKVNDYSADQNPINYIVVLSVAVQLRDQVKNRDLWKADNVTATSIYVPSATSGPGSEEEARQEAIGSLASDIVTRMLEQW